MTECVLLRSDINICKERECFDVAVLIHSIVHTIPLTNSLSFDPAEMDRLRLWIILHNFDNRKPINSQKMGVSTLPDSVGSR